MTGSRSNGPATRAARYLGDQVISVGADEPVAPGQGEVQVAVAYTGVCGTDLHILHGHMDGRVTPPAVLGHEMSGRIAALGPGVQDWSVGDPVTVMPLRWCGKCAACLAGYSHICSNLDFVGIDSPGSMRQLWTVPAGLLVALPAGLELRLAALVEPLAVAVHDVRRSVIEGGERAVVVGGGPVGFLIALVARARGADVMVVEVNPFRRDLLASVGLHAVDPSAQSVAALVADWTDGAGAEVAFEVSGSQAGVDTGLAVLGARGRVVVVGIHPQPRAIDLHGVFWRELSLIGARVYERTDFEAAVDLLARAELPVATLISTVQPLREAAAAFAALESGAETMKVLVDCGAP